MNLSPEQLWDQFGPIATNLVINIAIVVLIVVGGWIVAGWVQRSVRRGMGRFQNMDRTLVNLAAMAGRYFVLITVLIMVLGRFGVQTASIVAALGAIGLAIGLALQGALSNVAAGVMLLFLRPFRAGDYIDASGQEGTVDQVGLFTTDFTTYDGLFMVVPNSSMMSGRILNYTRNGQRRHDIIVRISYRDDIDRAESVLLEAIGREERVLTGTDAPTQPQVMVRALNDSSVDVGLRFWTSWNDYYPVSFDMRKAAKQALDAAGITIPFPQRDVHLQDAREGETAA